MFKNYQIAIKCGWQKRHQELFEILEEYRVKDELETGIVLCLYLAVKIALSGAQSIKLGHNHMRHFNNM